jgi:hypothetical protein
MNTPPNPQRKLMNDFCGISRATNPAAKATVHHGKNMPATKLSIAVERTAIKLFMGVN